VGHHWWNRRTQSATTLTVAPRAPETEQDARNREAAAIASYGRGLRAVELDGKHRLTDAKVYVCGVGLLPVSLAIAAARQAHTATPDDPAAAEALEKAETAMGAQLLRRRQAEAAHGT